MRRVQLWSPGHRRRVSAHGFGKVGALGIWAKAMLRVCAWMPRGGEERNLRTEKGLVKGILLRKGVEKCDYR